MAHDQQSRFRERTRVRARTHSTCSPRWLRARPRVAAAISCAGVPWWLEPPLVFV